MIFSLLSMKNLEF